MVQLLPEVLWLLAVLVVLIVAVAVMALIR
jgi:hypothetical protein